MKRLFQSLRQQLAFEIVFVKNVSRPYHDAEKKLDIVDFEYKGQPFQLVLNGNLMLKSKQNQITIESYHDLIHGLLRTNKPKKKYTVN